MPAAGASVAWPYDWFHLNSIALDADGSLLISARATWAVYDVDRASGRDQLAVRRTPAELRDGTGHGDRLAARRAPARARHAQRLRQRRPAVDAAPLARARRARRPARTTPPSSSRASRSRRRSTPRPRAISSACRDGNWWIGWGNVNESSEVSARAAGSCSRPTRRPAPRATARCASPGAAAPLHAPAASRVRASRATARCASTRAGTARRPSRAGGSRPGARRGSLRALGLGRADRLRDGASRAPGRAAYLAVDGARRARAALASSGRRPPSALRLGRSSSSPGARHEVRRTGPVSDRAHAVAAISRAAEPQLTCPPAGHGGPEENS